MNIDYRTLNHSKFLLIYHSKKRQSILKSKVKCGNSSPELKTQGFFCHQFYKNMIYKTILILGLLIFSFSTLSNFAKEIFKKPDLKKFQVISTIADPTKQKIIFFWKDAKGKNYSNFKNLKAKIESDGQNLIFATNGGIYNKNFQPKGLYIENARVLSPIDRIKEGYGNFYLSPNGIFYLKNNGKADITITEKFKDYKNIKYATQSGPMLVINGKIHPKFKKGSKYTNIRNGVGILPNGNILFAMSKEKVTLFDFALYFKKQHCQNALYLDGFISKTYLPSKKWEQMEGNFVVIIGIIESY